MTYHPPTDARDTGIAYGWLVLSIFLLVAAVLYSYSTGVVNSVINGPQGDQSIGINHDIKEGKMSHQSVSALNWNLAMWTNIPLFIIIGAFVWAVSRAIVVSG